MPTSQENIAKWCSNCDLQDFKPKVGVTCSLTNEKANFVDECPSFNLDVKQAKANDCNYIYQKYESTIASVRTTKKSFWRSLFLKKINKETKIRESSYSQLLPALIFILITLPMFVIAVEKQLNLAVISISITSAILIALLLWLKRFYKDKGHTVLILSEIGIKLDNNCSYTWEEIQTFVKSEPRWRYWLIVKKPLHKEHVLFIDTRKVSISRLEDIIERYKTNYNIT